jgi:hypothetical protein
MRPWTGERRENVGVVGTHRSLYSWGSVRRLGGTVSTALLTKLALQIWRLCGNITYGTRDPSTCVLLLFGYLLMQPCLDQEDHPLPSEREVEYGVRRDLAAFHWLLQSI